MAVFAQVEWVAAGTLVATAVLAILTAVYVQLTARLLRAQSDPCVITYTQLTDGDQGSFIDIVIENVGRGVARDVRIERPEGLDAARWDEFLNSATIYSGFRETFLRGFPALRPGAKVVFRWNRADTALLHLGDGLPVVCTCKRLGKPDVFTTTEVEPVECYLEMYPMKVQ